MIATHVYVVKGVCGLMKVGATRDPVSRIKSIRSMFKRRNDLAHRIHVVRCANGSAVEARLVRSIKAQGLPTVGREWFRGGDFDSFVQMAYRIGAELDAEDAAWEAAVLKHGFHRALRMTKKEIYGS